MEQTTLAMITKNKLPCYFISPHFDDAVFSAGSLLSYLSEKTRVSLVNVFTKAGNQHTLSAKAYLRQCNVIDAQELYTIRQREDEKAVIGIVDEIINLGFTEALWRKKKMGRMTGILGKYIPEVIHMYPTYRFHITRGVIAEDDNRIVRKLRKFCMTLPENAVLFCPKGIGDHVDHILVREACLRSQRQVVLWADFPYSKRGHVHRETDTGWQQWHFPVQTKEKKKLMQGYQSQYPVMFGSTLKTLPREHFFSREEVV